MGTWDTCFVVHTMVRFFRAVLAFHYLWQLSQCDAWPFSLGFGFPDSLVNVLLGALLTKFSSSFPLHPWCAPAAIVARCPLTSMLWNSSFFLCFDISLCSLLYIKTVVTSPPSQHMPGALATPLAQPIPVRELWSPSILKIFLEFQLWVFSSSHWIESHENCPVIQMDFCFLLSFCMYVWYACAYVWRPEVDI